MQWKRIHARHSESTFAIRFNSKFHSRMVPNSFIVSDAATTSATLCIYDLAVRKFSTQLPRDECNKVVVGTPPFLRKFFPAGRKVACLLYCYLLERERRSFPAALRSSSGLTVGEGAKQNYPFFYMMWGKNPAGAEEIQLYTLLFFLKEPTCYPFLWTHTHKFSF